MKLNTLKIVCLCLFFLTLLFTPWRSEVPYYGSGPELNGARVDLAPIFSAPSHRVRPEVHTVALFSMWFGVGLVYVTGRSLFKVK